MINSSVLCRIAAAVAFIPLTICAQTKPAPSRAPSSPLAAYLGHWESSGKFNDTKMSKAQSITSVIDCRWSPQSRDLVCEQTITDDTGTHQQLTIYMPTDDKASFNYYTISVPGKPAFTGIMKIDGDTWSYDNSFEHEGKKTLIRTDNVFSGDRETFKTEFSEDDGAHWTTMLEGTAHRTSK